MRQLTKSIALAAVVSMAATAGPAVAGSFVPVSSTPSFTMAVPFAGNPPNFQPGGAFNQFDISFVDSVTGNYFIADRSNAAVDIFATSPSNTSGALIGRVTGFQGVLPKTGAPNNDISGPDGVLTVTSFGNTTLYAGDGNSTLKVFNVTNPSAPVALQPPISTGGTTRVDEMAFAPVNGGLVLAANNAEAPAYGNLFQTTNGTSPVTLLTTPGVGIQVPGSQGGIAGGGMEQPAWNPTTGTFFVSIPKLGTGGASDPGGVTQISRTGTVLNTFSFASNPAIVAAGCSPTGLAVGASGNMLVGCGAFGSTVGAIMVHATPGSPATLSILKVISGIGGTDEIWFDPTTGVFYVTGNNNTNTGRFFDVVSDNGASSTILQTVGLPATSSAHSIAVDPFNGDVFVPLAGTGDSVCPLGCIAVFAPTPLPTALPLLATGLGALGLLGWRRKRKAAAA